MKTTSFFFFFFFLAAALVNAQKLIAPLQNYCKDIESEFSTIAPERKSNLDTLVSYLKKMQKNKEKIEITFICTHNSRRSQFAQVWAKIAATHYNIDINTYSGGTEATACNPRTIAALKRAGCTIENKDTTNKNPLYEVTFAKKNKPLLLFSKKYNNEPNPQEHFIAVLVCSSANESCPLVQGASFRLYNGYEDPKKFDGQPSESSAYDKTCRIIAREMFYVFSQVSN